jgi:PAS domain S-box-containing protein
MTGSSTVNDTGITMDQEAENNALSCLVANIFDAYPDKTPIYVKNHKGKYIGCSKGFLKLFGLTSDGVLGRTARELFPEHIAKEDEVGDRALQWVVGQENMEVAIDINGRERFLLFKKNGFCSGRGSLSGGVIGIVADITALKRRSVQKEMMDAFASVSPGVYHDINNLLTPIGSTLTIIEEGIAKQKISFEAAEDKLRGLNNLSSLLQKHLKEKLIGEESIDLLSIENLITPIDNFISQLQVSNTKYEKYLVVGIKALNQIKSILAQLSKLARVDLYIPVSEFNVNDIVVEATSMIFPGSNINKELFLCKNPWPINLDYVSSFRILLNLVVNAIQAMPSGGNLTCKTENEIINGEKYVKFTVADTGGGIPLEVLNEIDQPHATTKTGGHGYGLCVVSSLIRDCGGKKEIKSHPGYGTEFEVLIPVSKDHAIEVKDILHKCGNPDS